MIAGFLSELVGMDMIGPLQETLPGNNYLLVLVDYFTWWSMVALLSSGDSGTLADAILKRWVCEWGAPLRLDPGKWANFQSALVHKVCRSLDVDKTRTTSYQRQRNALSAVISLLNTFVGRGTECDLKLPLCACVSCLGTFIHEPNATFSSYRKFNLQQTCDSRSWATTERSCQS